MGKNKHIPFPRGKSRVSLARNGLVGKLHISSDMSENDVLCEVRSVFKDPMDNNPNFPFQLLQPTGEGSRSLAIPPVSDTFQWTAQQVARLGGSRGCIYILAEADLNIPESDADSESEAKCEEEGPSAQEDCPSTTACQPGPQHQRTGCQSTGLYRQYINLIDLSSDISSEGEKM